MSSSLVKGNLSIRAIHTFFNAIKQNLKLEQNRSRSDSGDPPMAGPEQIKLALPALRSWFLRSLGEEG